MIYQNIYFLVPFLAKQQNELIDFASAHQWFLDGGGNIFFKSTDHISDQIVTALCGDQVTLHVEADRSIYEAWNQCVHALSKHNLTDDHQVTFLGLDDVLSEEFCRAAATTAASEPDLDFIYGNSRHDLNGTAYLHQSPSNPKLFGHSNFLFDVPHPGMFNRWGTIKNYRFDTQFRLAADFDFYIGIALERNLKWKKLDLVQATLGGEGISASLNSKQIYLKEWAIIEAKRGVKLHSNKLHTSVTALIAKNPTAYKWLRQAWWKIKSLTR